MRSTVLGLAVGGRSSLGVAVPVLAATRGRRGVGPALLRGSVRLAVLGELVGDKMPGIPSRTDAPVLGARVASGALGGLGLALSEGRSAAKAVLASVAGAAGAWAGSYAGVEWRRWAAEEGPEWLQPDLRAGLVEDAVVLATAARIVERTPPRPVRITPRHTRRSPHRR
ncbi:hypothetical protein J4G33_12160 [Actinotalea sp. BY-33]|uniref:DUF4126 domain-containing protein n=1 Tax=Actinotalea soli TaxID=2819234 RepID=A0A939RSU7_9CELL|nr:hypothetical protein [Actinotalea soli]MBO1752557.1 hypothetical protein [Actinotalea soli]